MRTARMAAFRLSFEAVRYGSKKPAVTVGRQPTTACRSDNAAIIHNDPKSDTHEILVKKGAGEVNRNGETVHLADYEKVNFQTEIEQDGRR